MRHSWQQFFTDTGQERFRCLNGCGTWRRTVLTPYSQHRTTEYHTRFGVMFRKAPACEPTTTDTKGQHAQTHTD